MNKRHLDTNIESCDLCIIGAGIAGLNALFVATQYLPSDARVILVDRNEQCGGMWNDTYDYVRLHQPHPMFTTGDIAWEWNKPAHHLATGDEVLSHFSHCVDVIRKSVNLVERYGHNVEKTEEVATGKDSKVRVQCHVTDANGNMVIIQADRLINAIGFDIPVPDPLPLSSDQVISTTPQRLLQDVAEGASDNVYVVGGGKTGMDTIAALSQHRPGTTVSLINGRGTIFANRNLFAPTGAKRWWHGSLIMRAFNDVAMRFDGDNEEQVFDYFRKTYAISPDGTGEQFFFGLLSEQESAAIASNLKTTVKDYLADVVDTGAGPQVALRSGQRIAVKPGSVFVNCTGHVLRQEKQYEPYISEHGAILTINSRSAIHFLSSVSSYFLAHLFFLDKLPHAQLYAIDLDSLLKKGRKVWQMSGIVISFMNLIVLINTLPFKVMDRCGLDNDRWFPLHRRAAALLNIKINQKQYLSHCRKVLDRVGSKHGIRCGVLK